MANNFFTAVRKAAQTFSNALNGPARNATSTQRAIATGSLIGYPRTNVWEELSHDTSWNYVAIHTIGKQWAQASACVYDNTQQINKSHAADAPAEQRTPIHNHPALKLLKRPNPAMSGKKFMYLVASHLRATGGWIIWEVRDQNSKPCELWPLPRAWCVYQTGTEQFPLGYFRVQNPRGLNGYWGNNMLAGGFYLDIRDCIVDGYPNWLYPGEPQSPLSACNRIIDIMEQTDITVWSMLMNAPRPGMIFSVDQQTPLTQDQIDRMAASVEIYKAGPTNAGKVMFLENVKNVPSGASLADVDAVNIREQNKKFGLGVQGVPGIASGMREEVGSYSGDAATMHTFTELGVQPDLDYFAACLNARWGREEVFGEGLEIEFSAKRIDDPTLDLQKADKLFQGLDKGAASVNEWRASMKLKPIPGGDTYEKKPEPVAPGMPGDPSAPDQQADSIDDLDLGLDDLPDEDGPNERMPERQDAMGLTNRLKPSLNGTH